MVVKHLGQPWKTQELVDRIHSTLLVRHLTASRVTTIWVHASADSWRVAMGCIPGTEGIMQSCASRRCVETSGKHTRATSD